MHIPNPSQRQSKASTTAHWRAGFGAWVLLVVLLAGCQSVVLTEPVAPPAEAPPPPPPEPPPPEPEITPPEPPPPPPQPAVKRAEPGDSTTPGDSVANLKKLKSRTKNPTVADVIQNAINAKIALQHGDTSLRCAVILVTCKAISRHARHPCPALRRHE